MPVPRTIVSEDEFRGSLKAEGQLLLIDFYAPWCEPCKWLDQMLEEILPEIPPSTTIIKVNVDVFPDIAREFEVRSVPVLIAFKKGSNLWRMNGFPEADRLLAILRDLTTQE
jgi:thioredoxin 1